jgi:CBS domain containing-hemolysin-like protein
LIELVIGLIGLAATSYIATAQFSLEQDEDHRAGALAILRTLLLVLIGGSYILVSGPSLIWAFGLVLIWFSQQALGRLLGPRFGDRAVASITSILEVWQKLVAPIRLYVPEQIEEYEQELLESVEEFSETVVREVMVPRVDMEVVQADATLEDALSIFVSSGYSRLPVVGQGIDDVTGVLYLKDLARVTHQDPALLRTTLAQAAARKPFFTPESKPVSELLQQMQQAKTQIAIVSDEYGGVAGIATVEDLVEELVGEIVDEYDREGTEIELVAHETFRVSPRMTLDELSEHCELEITDEDVDTVGGLLIKGLGQLPTGGEVVTILALELTAERVDRKRGRLLSVLVRKVTDGD